MNTRFTFFLFFFFSFYLNSSFSQSNYFTVTESERFTDTKKHTQVYAVHTDDNDQTIIARGLNRELMFEIFDENAENIFYEVMPLLQREAFIGELFYDGEMKVFTVQKINSRTRIIYANILDIFSQEFRKVKLFEASVERGEQFIITGGKRQTHFALSPNESFLAIATDNIHKRRNSYQIHVFDAQSLELVYRKKYYEDETKRFNLSSLAIENDGTVYSLGKEYQRGRAEKKMGKANYEFVLCKINESGKEVMNIKLNDDNHVRTMKIANQRGEFRLIGFYSERNVNRIKGVTVLEIDSQAFSITSEKASPLPIEVFEDLYGSNRADRKSKRELENFYLDHVLEDDFGNIYMLAEEFYITQMMIPDGMGGFTTIDEYHYDDILVLKFDQTGNLAWGRSIFKRSNKPSYNAFLKDDNLHVLFNSGKNLVTKEDGRVKAKKAPLEITTALYDFIFEPDGNVVREKIQDNKLGNSFYRPHKGDFKNGRFIMFNHSRSHRRMMILRGIAEN